MFGLRQKLILTFGGLLVILLTVSGLGIAVSAQHRRALDKFLFENWRSVEYGQHMVEAVDALNDIAAQTQGRAGSVSDVEATNARAMAERPIAQFDKNLSDENNNITLEGERMLASTLTMLWKGVDSAGHQTEDNYRRRFTQLTAADASPQDRAAAYAAVMRLGPRVKSAAQSIINLNLNNMTPIEGRVKALADRSMSLMILLSGIGVALAAIFVVFMTRSILQPVRTLTQSARDIEQGNLDLVVQVRSRDELRQLAEAFNSMTAKLREYRRTNRAKLVRTQQTTQLAINSLPDAVAILSPDGKVEMANSAGERLFGMRTDAHVSELHAEWLVELYRKVTQDLRPVEPRGYEGAIQVMDESGGERFFLPHAVPILDDDEQLLGVTVVLADVTHLRRLDEMKSGMLSVVSHELKTPLTSIRMGVHLLLEERVGSLTGQQNDLLIAVREDSDRLNQIVENLLDMGRLQAGRALMELKPEKPSQLVNQATQRLGTAYHERGIELNVEIPDDMPLVMADAARVEHVFSNLLSNALKYTPPGGRVRVSAIAEDNVVRFVVEDTGPGIPREYQSRIFERFFRVPNQDGVRGAGLGLAIAKEIVEAHGGHIELNSNPGEGSRFGFTVRRADQPVGAQDNLEQVGGQHT